MSENINETSGIARRSVVKAAAWAAPVVAVAVSAPLASASITDGSSSLSIATNQRGTWAQFNQASNWVDFESDGGTADTGPITFTFTVPTGFTALNGGAGSPALGSSGVVGDWTYTLAGNVYTFSHAGLTLNSPGNTTVSVPLVRVERTDPEAPALSTSNQISASLVVQDRSSLNKATAAPS